MLKGDICILAHSFPEDIQWIFAFILSMGTILIQPSILEMLWDLPNSKSEEKDVSQVCTMQMTISPFHGLWLILEAKPEGGFCGQGMFYDEKRVYPVNENFQWSSSGGNTKQLRGNKLKNICFVKNGLVLLAYCQEMFSVVH